SDELYNISRWGAGFFKIADDGNLHCTPLGTDRETINMKSLIRDLQQRGIGLPVLLRFSNILGRRIDEVNEAFAKASREYDFKGKYRSVVPIKVNQQKHVVEELIQHGAKWHLGLEAGSKPELLAAI